MILLENTLKTCYTKDRGKPRKAVNMDKFSPQYILYLIMEYRKLRAKYRLPDDINADGKANWKTINGTPVLIDDGGNVKAGPTGVKNWASKEKTKYAPSPQRQKKGIQVSKKKYARLTGTLNTNFPGIKPEDGTKLIYDANYAYYVRADGYGGMIISKRVKIK